MNKITKYSLNLLFLLALMQFVVGSASAATISINLNDFFADPSVSVTAGGASASITETPLLFSTLLANDPSLGDPNIVIPGIGTTLNFSYDFTEAAGENNEFGVFIIDGATGGSVGSAFEFFTQDSSSGMISFDLTSLAGRTLGLQFELNALFGDVGLDSRVTVSDLFLQTADTVSVLEPPTLLLFFIGFIYLLLLSLKRNNYIQPFKRK